MSPRRRVVCGSCGGELVYKTGEERWVHAADVLRTPGQPGIVRDHEADPMPETRR